MKLRIVPEMNEQTLMEAALESPDQFVSFIAERIKQQGIQPEEEIIFPVSHFMRRTFNASTITAEDEKKHLFKCWVK